MEESYITESMDTKVVAESILKIVLGGLGSAVLFGTQFILFKEHMKRCEDGFSSAFTFLLFCGLLGFLSFIYFLLFDIEAFTEHTWL